MSDIKFTIIVPIFNEAGVVGEVLAGLNKALVAGLPTGGFEIIAVNDGSSDNSLAVLQGLSLPNFVLVSHPYNRGYGASLKTGAKKAKGEYIAFFDSDGQHKPEELLKVLKQADNFDMVVGARVGYKGPLWRQPGKGLIGLLANYLVATKIPDLNSGLRVINKQLFFKFAHLYPNGFSLTTTITLAFLKDGLTLKYIPITINKRNGKSTLKVKHGFASIMLAFRMIMLFSPLKVFLPFAFLLGFLGIVSLCFDVLVLNITDTTVILLVFSMIIFLFGLTADQIASLRRELNH